MSTHPLDRAAGIPPPPSTEQPPPLAEHRRRDERPHEPEVPAGPPAPTSVADIGLPFAFICDLLLKILYFNGNVLGRELGELACLPWPVISAGVTFLTKENFCGTTGARGASKAHEEFAEGLEYVLTTSGRERARETLALSQYAGPAPVPLEDYLRSAAVLVAESASISSPVMKRAVGDLVLPDSVVDVVGSALLARQALFLYGPPGNGKSSIAAACAAVLGEPIYVPHALYVHGEVVRLFDPVHHRPVQGASTDHDRRWILVERPVVHTGGELRAQQLEPAFDRVLGFYEAPLQVKANGGIFHVDDFGRQVISPREILNRLIVPLESGVDHLDIARAGTTISIPYATILLLSTNLDPEELVDEAFLRRVRYKTLVPDPDEKDFRAIFRKVCQDRRIAHSEEAVDYLLATHYRPFARALRGCQPRDLVSQLITTARYLGQEPKLSRELIDRVAHSYFAEFQYTAVMTRAPARPAGTGTPSGHESARTDWTE
ncbi:MAG: ATP-binding protein [Candidatus Dormiibacterota bacterium]